jgi:hypothetical protein
MSFNVQSNGRRGALPIILIAAVVQGWALYGLHLSITGKHWPATDPAWLSGLYAIAASIPLTAQMLAHSLRCRIACILLAGLTAMFFYFGWHHGAQVMGAPPADGERFLEGWLALHVVLGVLWLLLLPFIQTRIERGTWRAPYASLFANAWNNKLILLEAAVFTGLFWLLLLLWQQLFAMLGIGFFRELFREPVFVYPVTSITFGVALHLIGSLERLTSVVLEQVLNVLKWLALLAGLILALFTVALVSKLPGMIASGERIISASWLLWLVAITVLLVNAAYRDGSVARPYPQAVAMALRLVVPLLIVISLTAAYVLYVRIGRFGFTVDRVWGCVVAMSACVYSIGYAFAARHGNRWMASMARVNVIAAWLLIGVLTLTLTPALSPYRIAAASQFARVIDESPKDTTVSELTGSEGALRYLRFSSGEYGMKRLRQLATLENHPRAAAIRADAQDVLALKRRFERRPTPSDVEQLIANMVVQPKDRALAAPLLSAVKTDLAKPDAEWRYANLNRPLLGVWIDLDGDGGEEFVVIVGQFARVFKNDGDTWSFATRLQSLTTMSDGAEKPLDAWEVRAVQPEWAHLQVERQVFRETGLP